jgi:hypothetical protein
MNTTAPINPRATATAILYEDICKSSGDWSSGVGVGCGVGVGDGVGLGLGMESSLPPIIF